MGFNIFRRKAATQDIIATQQPATSQLGTKIVGHLSHSVVSSRPFTNNCFQVMDSVLDATESEFSPFDQSKRAAVKEQLDRLVSLYRQLDGGVTIDYSDRIAQYAYLYCYAPVRARLMARALSACPVFSDLLTCESLPVTCIAGGPGTDLLGFALFAETIRQPCRIRAIVCDSDLSWQNRWLTLEQQLTGYGRFEAQYAYLDIADEDTWEHGLHSDQARVYTLSYCLAEFRARPKLRLRFLKYLAESAQSSSYFVLTDVNHSSEVAAMDFLIESCGLMQIGRENVSESGRTPLTNEELAYADRVYMQRFQRKPQKYMKHSYLVCRKP